MKLLKTEDGSFTLYNEDLRETYHSLNGALSESVHVYIENGLKRLSSQIQPVHILEIGFGTGMNALLTMEYANNPTGILYHSLEPFRLDSQLLETYYSGFNQKPSKLSKLHLLTDSTELSECIPGFNFQLHSLCLLDFNPEMFKDANGNTVKAHLVYFDAFAPSKQPDMWTTESLQKVKAIMSPGSILVTYCAQGQFKRDLKALGFQIDTPPGAHGKREMTVATLL